MGNLSNPTFSLNCKGRIHEFNEVVLMGILNVTPDSFYDGGRHNTLDFAVEHAANMLAEGAQIIDVGGMSTRPQADAVSVQEELDRVIPVIEKLKTSFGEVLISVDTFRSVVARESIQAGAHIVNDISGGTLDEKLFETLAELNCPYILSHIQGTPQTMQANPQYEDVVLEVSKFFSERVETLTKMGVKDIILDPGFGFGKQVEHNYQLLEGIKLMAQVFDQPILAGLSRKSMLYKPLGITPEESLPATSAAHLIAIQNGARLLRVHDVKEAKQVLKIWEVYNESIGNFE